MASVPILQNIRLAHPQVIFLQEIARRASFNGNGMQFSWDKAREDVRAMVADLLHKQIVRYVEIVSDPNQLSGPTYLILTDAGKRVVGQLDDAQKQKTVVQSTDPEIKRPE